MTDLSARGPKRCGNSMQHPQLARARRLRGVEGRPCTPSAAPGTSESARRRRRSWELTPQRYFRAVVSSRVVVQSVAVFHRISTERNDAFQLLKFRPRNRLELARTRVFGRSDHELLIIMGQLGELVRQEAKVLGKRGVGLTGHDDVSLACRSDGANALAYPWRRVEARAIKPIATGAHCDEILSGAGLILVGEQP